MDRAHSRLLTGRQRYEIKQTVGMPLLSGAGVEEVAQGHPVHGKQDGARDRVASQRALLAAQGGLVAEELARAQPQHGLVRSVTLAADLDLSLYHDVVLALRVARAEDDLAGLVDQRSLRGHELTGAVQVPFKVSALIGSHATLLCK